MIICRNVSLMRTRALREPLKDTLPNSFPAPCMVVDPHAGLPKLELARAVPSSFRARRPVPTRAILSTHAGLDGLVATTATITVIHHVPSLAPVGPAVWAGFAGDVPCQELRGRCEGICTRAIEHVLVRWTTLGACRRMERVCCVSHTSHCSGNIQRVGRCRQLRHRACGPCGIGCNHPLNPVDVITPGGACSGPM